MSIPLAWQSVDVEKSDIFRHMNFKPDRPHDDLPKLPPPFDIEGEAVLKPCKKARVALTA